jgi:hypothetical protein
MYLLLIAVWNKDSRERWRIKLSVRSLAFLGLAEDPKASIKTRPPDLWPLVSPLLVSLPDCFSACKTTQELPVTQLARHVNLFHLVIADNRTPETLALPHGLAPPIKPTTHFSWAASLWTWKEWQPCGLVPINLAFPCVVVFIRQYLTLSRYVFALNPGFLGNFTS